MIASRQPEALFDCRALLHLLEWRIWKFNAFVSSVTRVACAGSLFRVPEALGNKPELRAAAIARRKMLGESERDAAAYAVADHAPAITLQTNAIVAGYMPIRGEIDPHPLMLAFAARGGSLALPTIAADEQRLIFRSWREGDPLRRGALGIGEPLADAAVVVPDVLLVPLAAFDRTGHRIGYGAGHYDRALAALRLEKPIRAIGLAFAVQEIPRVPNEAHDVPLDLVLTENEIVAVGSESA